MIREYKPPVKFVARVTVGLRAHILLLPADVPLWRIYAELAAHFDCAEADISIRAEKLDGLPRLCFIQPVEPVAE